MYKLPQVSHNLLMEMSKMFLLGSLTHDPAPSHCCRTPLLETAPVLLAVSIISSFFAPKISGSGVSVWIRILPRPQLYDHSKRLNLSKPQFLYL